MNSRRLLIKQYCLFNNYLNKFCFSGLETSSKQHRVQSFDCLKTTLAHCYGKRPVLNCIMFTASWNPLQDLFIKQSALQAEKDFETASNNFPGFDFVKVNTDKALTAKGFFGVKCEPEVMIYLQGVRMVRQIGPNIENLTHKLQKVQDYQFSTDCLDGTNVWEDFHAQFRYEWKYSHKVFDGWAR